MSKVKNHYHDEIEAQKYADRPTLAPSRKGSATCANKDTGRGSIASGGPVTYCTCDRCF